MIWQRRQLRVGPALADFLEERLLIAGWESLSVEREPGAAEALLSIYAETADALPGPEQLSRWLAEALDAGLAEAGAPLRWEEGSVAEEDWDAAFRAHFSRRTVAPGVEILPSWERDARPPAPVAPGAPLGLVIEPGQAFGTGEHPTTGLCLELLREWMAARGHAAPRALDVGSGTGVLSIAARLWGAGACRGYDVDGACIVNSYLNADLNGLAGALDFVWGEPAGLEAGAWELLLCNLFLAPILRLLPRLDAALAPGAGALLSGFLVEQAPRIAEAAAARGWRLEAERERDGWVAQRWAKPGL
ncbi:MAG: 50S ribosomal protein L11 methyltransferase [Candidatus Latescibacteria bacterium]|nr:50S ribosomal protein L11 methyltransferase [Candidatus Latescibacterota bacterium]